MKNARLSRMKHKSGWQVEKVMEKTACGQTEIKMLETLKPTAYKYIHICIHIYVYMCMCV